MGITGLLPFLKSIQRDVHLSLFKGKRAAVDSYSWLHKGSYSCSLQLVMGTEQLETLPFIKYCMKKVNLLRQHGITPIMVFDGAHLPTKERTERERRQRRKEYLNKGKELLKKGKRSEAVDCFQKSVDVSPEMALTLIKECRKLGVECVVAPYEADAQLTYLQKEGLADLVITEDSDLLVFGCERVLFKLDDSGHGKLVELKDLGKANKGLVGFTQDSFRQMCIFSGCDYLASVPGIGLGKSLKFMRRCNQNPTQVIKTLQLEGFKVPQNYEDDFRRAEHTFLYQLVFDPRTQSQIRLHPLPTDMDSTDVDFAGVELSPKKAVNVARGNIHPISQRVLDCYSPSKAPAHKTSSWTESVMGSDKSRQALPIQAKLPLTASEGSRGAFRAPKRRREECVQEPDLASLYGENAESSTKHSPDKDLPSTGAITSRFFSASVTEATPSDLTTGTVRTTISEKHLGQHFSESVRKQLFATDSTRESVRTMRSKYVYSGKRSRADSRHPLDLIEPHSQSTVRAEAGNPSTNPFLISKSSPKPSPSFTLTSPTVSSTEEASAPPSVMTSSSFLSPHPSLRQEATPSIEDMRKRPSTVPASKRVGRVGLPKSTSTSKFKAPRSTESQTTLSGYMYTRRPQLKH